MVERRYKSSGYLVWRGLERDSSKFGYFFSNLHIESFLGIETLTTGLSIINVAHTRHPQSQLLFRLELGDSSVGRRL